jgi:hypothetical protein
VNHPANEQENRAMATEPTMELHVPGHGYFTCRAVDLDQQIMLRLPSSVYLLQAAYDDRTGIDVSDVHTVTELLVMFADIDHYER